MAIIDCYQTNTILCIQKLINSFPMERAPSFPNLFSSMPCSRIAKPECSSHPSWILTPHDRPSLQSPPSHKAWAINLSTALSCWHSPHLDQLLYNIPVHATLPAQAGWPDMHLFLLKQTSFLLSVKPWGSPIHQILRGFLEILCRSLNGDDSVIFW
jgi:hypothetical protein